MKLKRIAIIAIVLVVSLIVTVLILFYYGKITILEGVKIIGVGVGVISTLLYFLDKIFGRTVIEINEHLNNCYFPMEKTIIDFQKERGFTSYSSEVIDNTHDLEIAFNRIIETNTDIKIDEKVMYMKVRFFSKTSNTNDNLNAFLRAIQLKIRALKAKKRKYL